MWLILGSLGLMGVSVAVLLNIKIDIYNSEGNCIACSRPREP